MAIDIGKEKPTTFMSDETLNEDEALFPYEAAQYLAAAWKRPFTTKDLANLRLNRAKELAKLGIAPKIYASDTKWRLRDVKKIAENITPPEYRPRQRTVSKKSLTEPYEA